MFSCLKCQENRYLNYEEYIYKCNDCKKIYHICCDCNMDFYKLNNLSILKKKFYKIFRYIIDIKLYINKIIKYNKLPLDIIDLIMKYIPYNYQYYSISSEKTILLNKIGNELQYIEPYGLQIKSDTNKNEFYSMPIFFCNRCLDNYNYFDFVLNEVK